MTAIGNSSQASDGRTKPRSSLTLLSVEKERATEAHPSSGGYSSDGNDALASFGSGDNMLQMLANSLDSGESRRRPSPSSSPTPLSSSHGTLQSSSRQSLRQGSISSKVSSLTKDSSVHSLDPFKIEIGDLTHMFGRAKEQGLLQAAFERLSKRATDKKEIVTIHGKAGTGKTALILDFKDAVSSTGMGYFSIGKFEKYKSLARPYSAIIQALNDLCEAISVGPDKDETRLLLNEKIGYYRLKEISFFFPNLRELIMGTSSKPNVGDKGDDDGLQGTSTSQTRDEHGRGEHRAHELPIFFRDFLRALCHGSHAIILSLDDLQWADEASLDCISSLIRDTTLANFMIVGAFRDDEDSKASSLSDHPEQNVTDIFLDNLPLSSVDDMLSDLTGTANVKDLANIVLQKTHGNPFSIFQFLEMLQRKELLVFSFNAHQWVWDVEEIKSKTDVTQNVSNVLVENIAKLPNEFRKLLTLSAVIGFTFDPKVVELIATRLEILESEYREHLTSTVKGVVRDAILGGLIHPDQTAAVMASQLELVDNGSSSSLKNLFYEESVHAAIQEAEMEGLIEKAVSRSKYKFAHDLLHKSFYEDCALDIERQKLHLHIGRILRSFFAARPEDELLFVAVDHLNKGRHYLDTEDERIDLIKLNQTSSEKARERRALFSAANFSSKAIDLVKFEHDWTNHYHLLLHVYNDAAKLNLACGRFDLSLRRCLEIHRHAENLLDKLAASYVRVQILFSQRKTSAAIQSCLSVLKNLDEPLHQNPGKFQILSEWRKTQKMIRRLGSDVLLSLPPMQDTVKMHAQRYLCLLVTMTFITVQDNLLSAAILRMIQNAITYGKCDFTPFAIASYGMVCTALGTMQEAIKYGEAAMQLCVKRESEICIPSGYAIFYSTLKPWRSPLVESIDPLMKAYRIGVGLGEVHFAAICAATSVCLGFHCAVPLDIYTEDLKNFCDQIKLRKQESVWAIIVPYWSAAMVLAGAGSREVRELARDRVFNLSFNDHTGSYVDELGLIWYNHHMIAYIVAYIFNDYESALASRKKMIERSRKPKGTHFMIHFELLFSGLLDFALYRKTGSLIALQRATRKTRKMQRLSRRGATNCEGMSLLLQAELKTRQRRPEPVIGLYEASMESFSKSGFRHLQAIANERLVEFLKGRKMPMLFWQSYLRASIRHYADWGASAKVNKVTEEYDMPARYSMGGTPCPILTIQDKPGHSKPITPYHANESELISTDFSSAMLTKKV